MAATQDGKLIPGTLYSDLNDDLDTSYDDVESSSSLKNQPASANFGYLLDQSYSQNYASAYSSYNQDIVKAIYQTNLRVNFRTQFKFIQIL